MRASMEWGFVKRGEQMSVRCQQRSRYAFTCYWTVSVFLDSDWAVP
jgi:hypothetical protein